MFHIISITLRKTPSDHAYHLRESFEAASLEEAHANHAAFKQSGVRCYVLRDGSTGRRYSLEQSQQVAKQAAFESAHMDKLRAIAAARYRSAARSLAPFEKPVVDEALAELARKQAA